MRQRTLGIVGLGIASVALLVSITGFARNTGALDQLDLLIDVRHALVSGYVEPPDQEAMIDAAVRGMIDAVDDPYTVYLTQDELEAFENHVRGSFSGIGAEIDIHNNRLRIVSPLEDSPAWRAGVLPGDVVTEIEGESTLGIKITEAVQKLTGEAGTDVTITVRHESGEEETLTITRDVIDVKTVRGLRRNPGNGFDYWLDPQRKIAYIRLAQFGTRTAEEFRDMLRSLEDRGMNGLVLDLRFNPGGLLEAAVAVSDSMLDGGQRIVSIKGRTVSEQVHSSTDSKTITDVPVVVLANEASASASEITAGALVENGRAQLVGTRTFGKGSVQQVRLLDSGAGALKMTNAYYYLPSGRKVHRVTGAEVWGVDPSAGQYVPMTSDETRAMLEARRNSPLLRVGGGDDADAATPLTPEVIEADLLDTQLAAGLRAMLGRLDTGDWPTVGEGSADAIVARTERRRLEERKQRLLEALDAVEQDLQATNRPAAKGAIDTDDADAVGGESDAAQEPVDPPVESAP